MSSCDFNCKVLHRIQNRCFQCVCIWWWKYIFDNALRLFNIGSHAKSLAYIINLYLSALKLYSNVFDIYHIIHKPNIQLYDQPELLLSNNSVKLSTVLAVIFSSVSTNVWISLNWYILLNSPQSRSSISAWKFSKTAIFRCTVCYF